MPTIANKTPIYVVESYVSEDGSSWYRKYSDGLIEQGGTFTTIGGAGASQTINLAISMNKVLKFTATTILSKGDSSTSTYSMNPFSGGSIIIMFKGWVTTSQVIWSTLGF